MTSKKLLIITQTFVPDPPAVGQYLADVAIEMARRGHAVRVLTSARGYEDPSIRYPPREVIRGVDIRRLPLGSFGKNSLFARGAGTALFMVQAFWKALWTPGLGGILFSTSPPMIGFVGALVGWIRRVPVAYWAMDLNPDQLITMRILRAGSWLAWFLERANRLILRRSSLVVALDRFMADRLRQRSALDGKLLVLPLWPHEQHLGTVPHAVNPFRIAQGWQDKFV
ncbi:MAG TPA: glycosyltransferase, partial [Pirellulaceae bacterium]